MDKNYQKAEQVLKSGGVVVLPTDTIYGVHALYSNEQAVEKIYGIQNRDRTKPFIILISNLRDLKIFDISLNNKTKRFLRTNWPNQLSIILPVKGYKYLHRGKDSLAFRLPKHNKLRELVSKTGPLISTSVNPEDLPPAKNIQEAKEYFGDKIDYYLDEGPLNGKSSTLVSFDNGKINILRQGDYKIDE